MASRLLNEDYLIAVTKNQKQLEIGIEKLKAKIEQLGAEKAEQESITLRQDIIIGELRKQNAEQKSQTASDIESYTAIIARLREQIKVQKPKRALPNAAYSGATDDRIIRQQTEDIARLDGDNIRLVGDNELQHEEIKRLMVENSALRDGVKALREENSHIENSFRFTLEKQGDIIEADRNATELALGTLKAQNAFLLQESQNVAVPSMNSLLYPSSGKSTQNSNGEVDSLRTELFDLRTKFASLQLNSQTTMISLKSQVEIAFTERDAFIVKHKIIENRLAEITSTTRC